MSLQMYYDNTTITDHSLFGDHQNILDMRFPHGFTFAIRNNLLGGWARSNPSTDDASFTLSLPQSCHR